MGNFDKKMEEMDGCDDQEGKEKILSEMDDIFGNYMGVMNGEMTFCDVSFKGGMLYYVTKEDIDNGDVEEEIRIFKIKDKEDYNLK